MVWFNLHVMSQTQILDTCLLLNTVLPEMWERYSDQISLKSEGIVKCFTNAFAVVKWFSFINQTNLVDSKNWQVKNNLTSVLLLSESLELPYKGHLICF